MMKELRILCYTPLNFWDKDKFSLDDWQIKVIKMIKDHDSILLNEIPAQIG